MFINLHTVIVMNILRTEFQEVMIIIISKAEGTTAQAFVLKQEMPFPTLCCFLKVCVSILELLESPLISLFASLQVTKPGYNRSVHAAWVGNEDCLFHTSLTRAGRNHWGIAFSSVSGTLCPAMC